MRQNKKLLYKGKPDGFYSAKNFKETLENASGFVDTRVGRENDLSISFVYDIFDLGVFIHYFEREKFFGKGRIVTVELAEFNGNIANLDKAHDLVNKLFEEYKSNLILQQKIFKPHLV